MSKFNYSAYEEAIKGLANLPNEIRRHQDESQSKIQQKKRQIDAISNKQIEELNKAEKLAQQQFDDVACEYKVLFSVPVSRPGLTPTSMSVGEALSNQNIAAGEMKALFEKTKKEIIEKKRRQIEAEKAEQRRIAEKLAKEQERRRRLEEEEERRQEEEYLKELERNNRSTIQKIFDFFKGQ